MSADDWEDCPVCEEYVKNMVEYLYGKVDEDIYNFAKELKDTLGNSDNWDVPSEIQDKLLAVETDDKKLDEYIDYLGYSWETLIPVEIRYNYGISKDGTYYCSFSAECHNCGTDFEEKKNE